MAPPKRPPAGGSLLVDDRFPDMDRTPADQRGRWLVARYLPCALFALKVSSATSSVGRTLVVPTPYAIKMALVDAAFRAGTSDEACALLLRALVGVAVRIAPPDRAVVSHTFLKVRQEPKTRDPHQPFISSVAYREFVFHQGIWRWAFDLVDRDAAFAESLSRLLPHVRYVGKRGSFVQYVGVERLSELGSTFSQPLGAGAVDMPMGPSHVAPLDDFGPDADLPTLSSYSSKRASVGKHRVFVNTLVPLGVVNVGPGFTEYRGGESGP